MRIRCLVRICALCTMFCALASAGAEDRLFPERLPGRQWARFAADGYSTPVTGVIYRDGKMLPGMPLGGLGTGFICIGADGTLDYVSTIFNAFTDRREVSDRMAAAEDVQGNLQMRRHVPTFRLPFLGMSMDGTTTLLSLKQIAEPTDEVRCVRQIDYWGHYPIADLEFDTKSPISVGLRAWTPFLPGQSAESNTPGAIFEVRLRNTSAKAKKVTMAFSFHGPRKAVDVGDLTEYKRETVRGAFSGQLVSTEFKDRKYAYALGVIGPENVRAGGSLDANGMDWASIASGKEWGKIAKDLPPPGLRHSGTSIAIDCSLDPGASKTIHFVLAWYAPKWKLATIGNWPPSSGSIVVNEYASRFGSVGEVATYIARNHRNLRDRVLAWQQVVYGEQRIPGWLQDSLINVLAVLAQNSFWMRSSDPNHWWGDRGFFCVNESVLACPQQSCIANDQFGEWPVNLLFPELGLRKLEAFKHYQKQDTGQTPSTLGGGTEPDRPWFDQQLSIDGQVYVQMVDRYRLSTGDDKVLDEWYPSVKAGMKFMFTQDKDGDYLPDVHGTSHYLDAWPMEGAAIHVSTYWLSTLAIAERMAKMQGDEAFAQECRSWYERGNRSIEQKLWNEQLGCYFLYNDAKTGKKYDTVVCDQFIGDLWAALHSVPPILPKERAKKVMATLERLNVAATPYGVRLACRPDGSEDAVALYSPWMIPSYSTLSVASAMVRSGDRHFEKLGLEIVRRTWHNLVIRQNMAWDMPCMVKVNGAAVYGIEYYHNTMLWAFPIAALKQDIREACSPEGFIDRIRTAGRGRH